MKKVLLTVVVLLFPLMAKAEVPLKINFQGKFSSTGTLPTIEFRIVDSNVSDTALSGWSYSTAPFTTNGVVSLILGEVSAIPKVIFTDTSTDRYLWVKVGSNAASRTQLVSVPFSYRASIAEGISTQDVLPVLVGGTKRFEVGTTSVTAVQRILVPGGTPTSPGVGFNNGDDDNGIYYPGTNNLGFSVNKATSVILDPTAVLFYMGGTKVLELNSARMRPETDAGLDLGSSTNKWGTVYASVGTINTSSSKLKKNIREINIDASGETSLNALKPEDIQLNRGVKLGKKNGKDVALPNASPAYQVPRGIIFEWTNPGNPSLKGQDFIGFMGDDLPLEAHGLTEDGARDPESFYTNAVIGILCATVREQQRRIEALERKLK
jgi:hypothetical protein